MARVKRGTTVKQKHKKLLSLTKGYRHGRKNLVRRAKEAMLKAGVYSYRDRKVRRRVKRSQWIITLNAAVRQYGISYSQFIKALNESDLKLDRKVLAELAENHPEEFSQIISKLKK